MGKKILFIIGSLRKGSHNLTLAKEAEKIIGGRAEVSYLDYHDIPFMNQDIEFPAPKEIERVRNEALNADGVWIFTPEYNFQIPGVLKNLLDWLSRSLKPNDYGGPTAVSGKPVTVSGVGGRMATANCRKRLGELLPFMRMTLLKDHETGASLPPEAFQTGIYHPSEETKASLALQAEDLLKAIENK